jgi:hypothetical protein
MLHITVSHRSILEEDGCVQMGKNQGLMIGKTKSLVVRKKHGLVVRNMFTTACVRESGYDMQCVRESG